MVRKPKTRRARKPMLVKIEDIHIPKQDYPTSGQFPPDSPRFEELKVCLKKQGQLIPVFINADKLLLQGHYRLWALQAIGEVFIKALMVENVEEIEDYFESIPVCLPKE